MSNAPETSSGSEAVKHYFADATTREVTKSPHPAPVASGQEANASGPSVAIPLSVTLGLAGQGAHVFQSTSITSTAPVSDTNTPAQYSSSGHKVVVKTYAVKRG